MTGARPLRLSVTEDHAGHPADSALARAQRHLDAGEGRRAAHGLAHELRRRPHHVATLLAAADAAVRIGDAPQAVRHLEHALREQPHRRDIQIRLAETRLDAGSPEQAARLTAAIPDAPISLRARILDAHGRFSEAIELLEWALSGAPHHRPADDADDIHVALIDMLENAGRWPHLRSVLERAGDASPVVAVRAARAWLGLGRFDAAARLAAEVRDDPVLTSEALSILAVAASMADRPRLADRALARLERKAKVQSPDMADLWRRAFTGRLISTQADAGRAGTDRNASMLQPLLRSALRTFGDEPGRGRGLSEPREIDRMRSLCLAAAGGIEPARVRP